MGFHAGSSDNGNVASWTATGNQAFTRAFSYDSLNRISTLSQSSGTANNCSTFALSWNYDAWGNRTDQNVTSGTCNAFHASVNSNNQLSGSPYQYDAAGNMTGDGNHTYYYDGENRLVQVDGTPGTCSTATACYVYDALGRRVEKAIGSTYHDYIYDLAGNVMDEYCVNCGGFNGWTTGYIYFNGQFAALYSNATTYFVHPDHLGSMRLLTGYPTATPPLQNLDYLPFGEITSSNSGYTTHEFTGDERDSESGAGGSAGLDHTWFRQYSSQFGRWMHPDPAGLGAVNPSNPQSWNRYAYVMNDPMDYIDPLGLCGGGPGTVTSSVGVTPTGPPTVYGSDPCGGGGPGAGGSGCPPISLIAVHLGDSPFGAQPESNPCAPNSSDGGGGGGGAGGASGHSSDVNKTWSRTVPCNKNATQVMSAVQNNMGQFADNRSLIFAANFPSQPIQQGGQYVIQPGLNSHSGGNLFPTGTLVVTVTSQSASGWTFTTDPSQHYINGTVSFSATDAGNGGVTFSVTANGHFTNLFYKYVLGPTIKAGENSTWNNMLNSVQGYCQLPTGN